MSTDLRSLIDAVDSWALPFFAHRDEMNANLHAAGTTKWSEVTKMLALGLYAAREPGYWQNKVMYAVHADYMADREAVAVGQESMFTAEEVEAIEWWETIR